MRPNPRSEAFRQRLAWQGSEAASGLQRFLIRVAAAASAIALLVLMLLFSAVLFAVVLSAGLLVWARVWWKTRALRRQLRTGGRKTRADGRVIDGEVIR